MVMQLLKFRLLTRKYNLHNRKMEGAVRCWKVLSSTPLWSFEALPGYRVCWSFLQVIHKYMAKPPPLWMWHSAPYLLNIHLFYSACMLLSTMSITESGKDSFTNLFRLISPSNISSAGFFRLNISINMIPKLWTSILVDTRPSSPYSAQDI